MNIEATTYKTNHTSRQAGAATGETVIDTGVMVSDCRNCAHRWPIQFCKWFWDGPQGFFCDWYSPVEEAAS